MWKLFAVLICCGVTLNAGAERARIPLSYYAFSDLSLQQVLPDGKGGGAIVFSDPAGVRYRQALGQRNGHLPLHDIKKDSVSLSLMELGANDDWHERIVEWKLNTRMVVPAIRTSHRAELIAAAPAYSREISNWIKQAMPADPQARREWLWANNGSKYAWCVGREAEQVVAWLYESHSCAPQLARRPSFVRCTSGCKFLEVDDGWIIAFTHGEWGGVVAWFSASGQRSRVLSRHQVEAFVSRAGRIYAIEGLAHLSASRGSVIEIAKNGAGLWAVSEKLRLKFAPHAVSLGNDQSLLVALDGGLIAVGLDWKVRVVGAAVLWGGLNPKSSVLSPDGKFLYVGMSQYVGKIRLADGVLQMLLPSAQFAFSSGD